MYRLIPVLAALILLSPPASSAAARVAPEVSNVQFEEEQPGFVTITYDLAGNPDKRYTVDIVFSNNGGLTFEINPISVNGDVGRGVFPGPAHRVIWNVIQNYPEGMPEGDYICRVTAKKTASMWPWFAGGAAVVAGGVAAILLSEKEEEEPTTGTLVIEVPSTPP